MHVLGGSLTFPSYVGQATRLGIDRINMRSASHRQTNLYCRRSPRQYTRRRSTVTDRVVSPIAYVEVINTELAGSVSFQKDLQVCAVLVLFREVKPKFSGTSGPHMQHNTPSYCDEKRVDESTRCGRGTSCVVGFHHWRKICSESGVMNGFKSPKWPIISIMLVLLYGASLIPWMQCI